MRSSLYGKSLSIIISSLVILSVNANIFDHLKLDELPTRVKEEYANLDVGLSLKMLDLDVAEGVGLSSKYKYEVEQSDIAGLHARIDKWNIKLDINAGDLLGEDSDLPVFLNIEKGSEVHFVRQFEKKSAAMKAMPYGLTKLPLTPKKALELNAGDFVSMPTKMSIIFGLQASTLSNYVSAKAKVYAAFNGTFLVQVFKMKDSLVRLKIIAQKDSSKGSSIEGKLDYDLFGVSIVDKQVERIFDFKLADMGISTGDGDQLIVDYIFDLSNKEAAKAYLDILGTPFKFSDVKMFSDFLTKRNLEDRTFSTYVLADTLANEDKDLEIKRVERIFKGFNKFEVDHKKLKLSVLLAQYERNWRYIENMISFDNQDNERFHFFYPTYTFSKAQKIGIGRISSKEKTTHTWFGLVPTDDNSNWGNFADFGINYERKDQFFRLDEQVKFQQYLADLLPESIYEKISWNGWDEIKDRFLVNAKTQVVIKSSAFGQLKGLKENEIKTKLYNYYKERKLVSLTPVDGLFKKIWRMLTLLEKGERKDIVKISSNIYQFINNETLNGKERLELLFELRDKVVFKKVGLAFMISLLDEATLEDNIYVELELGAKETEPLFFKLGAKFNEKLYEQLFYVNSVLNDRSYDLRLTQKQIEFEDFSSFAED